MEIDGPILVREAQEMALVIRFLEKRVAQLEAELEAAMATWRHDLEGSEPGSAQGTGGGS